MAKRVPFDPLATARTKPLSLKSLALNPADLYNKGKLWEAAPSFPREILACKNLEKLLLFRAIRGDATIPDELGTLTKLRELTLGGMSFSRLPETLGKLAQLEVLDLTYSDTLEELPASIGKLAHLRTLIVDSAFMSTVPATLWKLTKLRRLALPESLTALPRGIAKLAALEDLALSASALLSIAGELARLTKLRELRVDGELAELPVELGRMPALVELTVSARALPRLSHLVAAAPKLKRLNAFGEHANPAEKRLCAALLKLAPGKRAAAFARATS